MYVLNRVGSSRLVMEDRMYVYMGLSWEEVMNYKKRERSISEVVEEEREEVEGYRKYIMYYEVNGKLLKGFDWLCLNFRKIFFFLI